MKNIVSKGNFLKCLFIVAIPLHLLNCSHDSNSGHQLVKISEKIENLTSQDGPSYESVRPILKKHCSACHPGQSPNDWLDAAVAKNNKQEILVRVWKMRDSGSIQKMPKEDKHKMTLAERQAIKEWAESTGSNDRSINTVDGGEVLSKKLTQIEKLNKCFGCHGQYGVSPVSSDPSQQAPNLIGQTKSYLIDQLKKFAGRSESAITSRKSDTMSAMVNGLSNEDFIYIANYFTKIDPREALPKGLEIESAQADLIEQGFALSQRVDMSCNTCHLNTQGKANGESFPSIAGQKSSVILNELNKFLNGSRKGTLMPFILKSAFAQQKKWDQLPEETLEEKAIKEKQRDITRLSYPDLVALAAYYESLVPSNLVIEVQPKDQNPSDSTQ